MALEDVKAVARHKHTNHTGDRHVLLKLSRVISIVRGVEHWKNCRLNCRLHFQAHSFEILCPPCLDKD